MGTCVITSHSNVSACQRAAFSCRSVSGASAVATPCRGFYIAVAVVISASVFFNTLRPTNRSAAGEGLTKASDRLRRNDVSFGVLAEAAASTAGDTFSTGGTVQNSVDGVVVSGRGLLCSCGGIIAYGGISAALTGSVFTVSKQTAEAAGADVDVQGRLTSDNIVQCYAQDAGAAARSAGLAACGGAGGHKPLTPIDSIFAVLGTFGHSASDSSGVSAGASVTAGDQHQLYLVLCFRRDSDGAGLSDHKDVVVEVSESSRGVSGDNTGFCHQCAAHIDGHGFNQATGHFIKRIKQLHAVSRAVFSRVNVNADPLRRTVIRQNPLRHIFHV